MRKSALGVAALLLPMLTLSGCSASAPELEAKLVEIDRVQGAWVKTTTSGSPTNRGLLVRLYLSEEPGSDVSTITDEALRIAWQHGGFEPSNGVSLQMDVSERPAEPQAIDIESLVNLQSAAEAEGIDLGGQFGTGGSTLRLRHAELEERFGEWQG